MPRPLALSTVSKKVSLLKVQHWRESFMPSFSEAESSRLGVGESAAGQEWTIVSKVATARAERQIFMAVLSMRVVGGETARVILPRDGGQSRSFKQTRG